MDIKNILINYSQGSRRDLETVLRNLQPTCETKFLMEVLKGFRSAVSMLHQEQFELVVGTLLNVEWISRSDAVVQMYQSLLYNLVSAHSCYLLSVLKSMVSLFTPKINSAEPPAGLLLGQADVFQQKLHISHMRHVHTVIKALSKLVPTTSTLLPGIICEMFPFLGKEIISIQSYVQNILHIAQYLPELRPVILTLIVEKMIYLDVRCHRDKIEEAENSGSDDEMDIFDMETDGVAKVEQNITRMKIDEADKLDILMSLTFNFIKVVCHGPGDSLLWDQTKALYLELLTMFDRLILRTHESCHVQFLLFYICSFKQPLADGFLDYLWKKIKDPNEAPVYRQEAIAYMASFLARAKYIPIRTAADCIDLMCQWVHKYIKAAHLNAMQFDIIHHGPFYTVCQAIFYVLVFRQKEFIDMENGFTFFNSLSLQTIVTCKLNPLRVCLPTVVKTFAAFVRHFYLRHEGGFIFLIHNTIMCQWRRKHQLAFCDSIIERNSRMMIPLAGEESQQANLHLESYFPFDPYLLVRSEQFVDDIHREFEGNAIVDVEKPIEDEDDDFVADTAGSFKQSYGKSPAAEMFLGSISPGFNVPR